MGSSAVGGLSSLFRKVVSVSFDSVESLLAVLAWVDGCLSLQQHTVKCELSHTHTTHVDRRAVARARPRTRPPRWCLVRVQAVQRGARGPCALRLRTGIRVDYQSGVSCVVYVTM